jgi:hypothetical protein
MSDYDPLGKEPTAAADEAQSPEDFAALINELSQEFDTRTVERHERGEEKYGPFKWLSADLIEELLQELLDTANYGRYHYIKLRMLQMYLAKDERLQNLFDTEGQMYIGVDSFFPAGGKSPNGLEGQAGI